MRGKVDLHLHSTESDGRLSPAALVELAHRNGVSVLALTDHDTTAGLPAARATAEPLRMEVIAGVELSADAPGLEMHLLGHFLREDDADFQALLKRFREGRIARVSKIAAKLAELGAPISVERVFAIAGEASVGRPHVAQALLEAGHVRSINEAFQRFLANDGPAYVGRDKLPPDEAIAAIHAVDGVAVLAHPLDLADLEARLPRLVGMGLDGLECYYQGYSPDQVQRLVGLARQHGLVPTGGSDYHGFPLSSAPEITNEPGSVDIPPEVVAELQARSDAHRRA